MAARQLVYPGQLQDVAAGPCGQGILDETLIRASGEHEHLGGRVRALERTNGGDPIQPGEPQIHQYHLRLRLRTDAQRRLAISRFPNHVNIARGAQSHPDDPAHRGMIVHQDHSYKF